MTQSNIITAKCGCVRYHDKNGQYHREDGPALELCNGDLIWYIHGKIHRENNPAVVNNKTHITGIAKEWSINDQLHREDGPAREFFSGKKEYWLFGKRIPVKKYTKKLIRQIQMTRIIET